jgi:hypothetical protein
MKAKNAVLFWPFIARLFKNMLNGSKKFYSLFFHKKGKSVWIWRYELTAGAGCTFMMPFIGAYRSAPLMPVFTYNLHDAFHWSLQVSSTQSLSTCLNF